MEGLIKGLIKVEGSMEGLINDLMENFAEDFIALIGAITALGALEGFKDLKNYRIYLQNGL